ncbi:energy transducer TonB [Methylobacterium durans]|uniref:energy transducer TonB family protein n=1 Tax=Methylobacterium durans TaxID=2202825 RepID=UPI002AFF941F|nr:energy transducer TonB [Methylobacterium durans]MEA1833366.1 energy transducer TonB [Methylobacterium durans]
MMRALLIAAACVCVSITTAPVYAQTVTGHRFSESLEQYKFAVSRIIHNRLQTSFYRSSLGGISIVTFDLDRHGTVTKASLRTSSGSSNIDSMALKAVPVGFQFPPIPEHLGITDIRVTVPLRYGSNP